MIKAIEAYKIMCDAIMANNADAIDPVAYTVDAIEFCVKREAENGHQCTHYGVDCLKEDQIKEIIKIVRNEGYLVMRDGKGGKVLDIQW